MTDPLKGVLAMFVASVTWGLSGIYYKALDHIPASEILAHRTIWSFVFLGLVLAFQGRIRETLRHLRHPRTLMLVVICSVLISSNWGAFIFSIQRGWAMESSFGYYIFPLVAVALGFLFLRERFSSLKWLAVGIATIAVVTLGVGLGNPPWMSLFLAFTFAFYGLIKSRLNMGSVQSVFAEVLMIQILAIIWLTTDLSGSGGVFGSNWHDSLMLAFSGIITGGPLILMSYAARRISLTALGLVQYVNPTLQFLVATFLFMEPFTKWHAIAFPMIWIGLAIFSFESWRQERSSRIRVKSAGTSSTT